MLDRSKSLSEALVRNYDPPPKKNIYQGKYYRKIIDDSYTIKMGSFSTGWNKSLKSKENFNGQKLNYICLRQRASWETI